MNWLPLARKEFRSLKRSKGLWVLAALLLVSGLLSINVGPTVRSELGATASIAAFQRPVGALIGFAGLLVGFRAIVGERESGSLKFPIGLPHTRLDVVLGKLVGRTAALSLPILVAIPLGVLVGVFVNGVPSILTLVLFVLVSLLYALTLVAIGIGISALVRTSTRAAAVILAYVLVVLISWKRVSFQLYTLSTGNPVNIFAIPASPLLFLAVRLSPIGAFYLLTNTLFGVGNSAAGYQSVLGQFAPNTTTNALVVDITFQNLPTPFYLNPWLAPLILVAWMVLVGGLGYLKFSHTNIH